ncbi:MAG: HAD family hydrolase [Clostridiales bacterium]|nr:HAD family hydrolase [Clostridiales bacterium]
MEKIGAKSILSEFSTNLTRLRFTVISNCRLMTGLFIGKYSALSIHHVSGTSLYDVSPPSAVKANAAKVIAGRFGVPISEAAAFGDDSSDVDMLRECGA